ncbi:hypothetical protein LOAG_14177 [Loa loa]|uniref:Uncharacterized protein n=1 Tax=Loa loa TaxID=7209 RepID=A0A1S0TI26_LOALO|nr:hypothetical protein LOAG_14177 [Loa loa]EFO14345.2 hypothetical protein LOAG_14177 [Loa loa]
MSSTSSKSTTTTTSASTTSSKTTASFTTTSPKTTIFLLTSPTIATPLALPAQVEAQYWWYWFCWWYPSCIVCLDFLLSGLKKRKRSGSIETCVN